MILPQYICLEILQHESALNILQWNISVSNWIILMCKKVTPSKYCSGKVFWIFSPIKYPLKRAVGQHCYGKTFSGRASISQESRLSLGPTGLAVAGANLFTKCLSPKTVGNTSHRIREIHWLSFAARAGAPLTFTLADNYHDTLLIREIYYSESEKYCFYRIIEIHFV